MQFSGARFHFVGIGGIGMCGLAELLHNMGALVTGSDLSENANTERLKGLGISVAVGHRAENVGDVDVLVFSSAVKMDNPEIVTARSKHIPVIARAEALAEIMRLKRGIAIGGTHGKTTTTAMTASIFLEAKKNPTIVVGGRLGQIQSTALLGQGEWLIAEADESDGSFDRLSPEIAVVTNIDNDHMEYFGNMENLCRAFVAFAGRVPFYGGAIVCGDDPLVRSIFSKFTKRMTYYGFAEDSDYQVVARNGYYQVKRAGQVLGEFKLAAPGRHNALNALAAVLVGLSAGISIETCIKGIENFSGVDRRFQLKGESAGVLVYDDYGHHPTEVKATLQAFREKFPNQKIVVLFQPHRFTRTQTCWDEFTRAFAECDEVIVTDIYAASEQPIKNITSPRLAAEMQHKNSSYLEKNSELALSVAKSLQPSDVLVTLGAGDVWKVGMEVLACLK